MDAHLDIKRIVAAVRSALPADQTNVALHQPEFSGNEWAYVKECLDTGWVSSAGKHVDRFEQMLADFTGAKHAVATVNGTSALHICLLLCGVQRGDEVLIPSLTFVATANAVSYAGAIPHFVDSEETTLGVDARKLHAHLDSIAELKHGTCINRTTGRVIRALMPMHVFGHPADIQTLNTLCERWHIVLIEDAAESLGSYYHGIHTGNFGRIAGLSFNGNKTITTGGGGAILTNDASLAKQAKHLTTTARVAHQWSFIHDAIGYNYRMPNINAALGCAQIEQLPEFLRRKRALAEKYLRALNGIAGVRVLKEPAGCSSNYWLNTLILENAELSNRDMLLQALNDAGLMARPAWTLMHKLPMYLDCPQMPLLTAASLEQRIINIPSSAYLSNGDH